MAKATVESESEVLVEVSVSSRGNGHAFAAAFAKGLLDVASGGGEDPAKGNTIASRLMRWIRAQNEQSSCFNTMDDC